MYRICFHGRTAIGKALAFEKHRLFIDSNLWQGWETN